MTSVQLISRPGSSSTGIGRYADELQRGLLERGVDTQVARLRTHLPGPLEAVARRHGYDTRAFLNSYPLRAEVIPGMVTHITSQTLGSLLLSQRLPRPVVVTVHDILPYILRNDPALRVYQTAAHRMMDRLAMLGLRRADRLVADSEYSRQSIEQHLGIPANRVDVVYLGIDQDRYRPLDVPHSVRDRYRLTTDRRYLIYVGSEDPRKNLAMLIEALAHIRRVRDDVELLKVGRPHFAAERERLIQLARNLGVLSAIHLLDDVPEDDLPYLYSVADVCVMPSRYEGFGFPVLEAMACGTPVVSSIRTSLSELVGDAALTFDPERESPAMMAFLVRRILDDEGLRQSLRQRGLERAKRFQWTNVVDRMLGIYTSLEVSASPDPVTFRSGKWL